MWERVKTVGEEFQVTASWLRGCQDCKTKVANMRNLKHILISLHFFLLHAVRSVNQSFNYLQYFSTVVQCREQ